MGVNIKVDSYFYDWQSAEGEALWILLQVYLLHCRLGVLAQFQLEQVQMGGSTKYHVHSAFWGGASSLYELLNNIFPVELIQRKELFEDGDAF